MSMSFASKVLPFAVAAAALISACSDASYPTQALSAPDASLAKKGSGSGGGDASGGMPLVVTTPPTANATGTWKGTTDGPDITHNYTYTLTQTSTGIVTGSGFITTPFTTVSEAVVGTVNGDTLTLAVGTLSCSTCTFTPFFRGIISYGDSQIDGKFLNGGVSPITLYKQQ
jgi:hypothetical protein